MFCDSGIQHILTDALLKFLLLVVIPSKLMQSYIICLT